MVNTTGLPPAIVLVGDIEVIDGARAQSQDTIVASAITSTHKTDNLAAFALRVHRWQTGSEKRGVGELRAIQESRRDQRVLHAARGPYYNARPAKANRGTVTDGLRTIGHIVGFLTLAVRTERS